jgi:beta-lactamase class A
VARQVAHGKLSWEECYAVPPTARVQSDGVLGDLSPGLRMTLHDIAHLMITISDNTASNLLLDLVGMDAVNATMHDIGLTSTRLERHFIDFAARQAGLDNWTTAEDMTLLFSYLCTHHLANSESLLRILLRQNYNSLLPAYWGDDVPFAHKTGGLAGIIHDAGILYPPYTPHVRSGKGRSGRTAYIIVALTADQPDVPFTSYILSRIGKIIYDAVK